MCTVVIVCLINLRAFRCVPVPPGRPSITLTDRDIEATSLTVRWSAPAGNGGRPVTRYKVVISLLESGRVVKNVIVGLVLHTDVRGLLMSTRYRVEVSAVNVAGAGSPGTEDVTTKYEGIHVQLGLPIMFLSVWCIICAQSTSTPSVSRLTVCHGWFSFAPFWNRWEILGLWPMQQELSH